ncbi:UBIQUINONE BIOSYNTHESIS PROTEIN COQ4-like protein MITOCHONDRIAL [Salix koriyanagi]|uniref:Ubiquinone biosynthesis protein COQ4 homolog, mitochondrial n=2 Tax=Salix koriyanagi TaxID=2511006 RepID=A0A9Q0WML6_9ROSI|nr:UBIQUINONE BIOSYNTHESIS PROTEIN COQ4-like protein MITOCHONDRIAL [Salix koriyanagi]
MAIPNPPPPPPPPQTVCLKATLRSRRTLAWKWKTESQSLETKDYQTMIGGGKIRLNRWQQAAVAVGSAVGALLDPRRADLIAALGETTGKPAFERVLERMKKSPEGRAVLLERPRVISAQVGHAWDLPANTFGAAYARFMGSRNFSPDDRPPVRFMETEELAYVAMRAREVHDFWHTLFALPTNLIGESALKVIEFEQMHLPMCLMSVVGGTARFTEKQRKLFFQHYFPWAIRAGMQSTDLMCVYYEKHFQEDLEDVRRKWGITTAPAVPNQNVP